MSTVEQSTNWSPALVCFLFLQLAVIIFHVYNLKLALLQGLHEVIILLPAAREGQPLVVAGEQLVPSGVPADVGINSWPANMVSTLCWVENSFKPIAVQATNKPESDPVVWAIFLQASVMAHSFRGG